MKKRNGAKRHDRTIIDTRWLSEDRVRLTFGAPHKMIVGNVFPVAEMVFTVEAVPNPKMIEARKWPEKKVEQAAKPQPPPPVPLTERLRNAARALAGRK